MKMMMMIAMKQHPVSQQLINGNPAIVNKSLYPAITYWLALTTPSGAPASPIIVNRTLLTHGLSIAVNTASKQFCVDLLI